MNTQSIDRKMARCQRDIDAARKPSMEEACAEFLVNTAVNIGGGVYTFLTEEDCRQIKGAAKASNTATREQKQAQAVAPPSASKFRVGDRVRYLSRITCMAGAERVVSAVRENYQHGKETVTRIEFTCGPHSWDRADCLELISPTPDAEGWNGELIVGMPYWCETIWNPCFSVWMGNGWFGCTPDAKLLRGLFLSGKAGSAYKTGEHIKRVIRPATEAELVKP